MSFNQSRFNNESRPAHAERPRASLLQAIALAAAAALTAEGCAAGNAQAQLRTGEITHEDQLFSLEGHGADISANWSPSTTAALDQITMRIDPEEEDVRIRLVELQESIVPLRAVEERSGRSRTLRGRDRSGEFYGSVRHTGFSAAQLQHDIRRFNQAYTALDTLTPHQISAILEAIHAEAREGHLSLSQTRQIFGRLRPGIEMTSGYGREFNREEVTIAYLSTAERQLMAAVLSHAFTRWPGIPANFMQQLVHEAKMEYGVASRLYLSLCNGGNLADDMVENHNWESAFEQVDPQGLLTQAQRESAINRINVAFARSFMAFLEERQQ